MRVGLVGPLSYNTDDMDDSDLALAETTLRAAEDLFQAELDTADTIDLKAVGLLAADVAALAVVVTFHRSLASWWWLAAILLAVSCVCFFFVLWQRNWELGIDPTEFWQRNRHRSRLEILEDALAVIERNREHNEPFLESKADWFSYGYWSLFLGLASLVGTLFHVHG